MRGSIPDDFRDLPPAVQELLRFAPDYAVHAALEAINQAMALQTSGDLRPGLYYAVLADLVGSTDFNVAFGNEALSKRIENFVSTAIKALTGPGVKEVALFIKELGDAVLLMFRHFPDIMDWHDRMLDALYTLDATIEVRTLAHAGEVAFDGVNPLALTVSQLFKMEKYFQPGYIGVNEQTLLIATPSMTPMDVRVKKVRRVNLPGLVSKTTLYAFLPLDAC